MLVLLFNYTLFVRLTGLEPAHRKTLDPKSSASTNFATDATIVLSQMNYLILFLKSSASTNFATDATIVLSQMNYLILFLLFLWQR